MEARDEGCVARAGAFERRTCLQTHLWARWAKVYKSLSPASSGFGVPTSTRLKVSAYGARALGSMTLTPPSAPLFRAAGEGMGKRAGPFTQGFFALGYARPLLRCSDHKRISDSGPYRRRADVTFAASSALRTGMSFGGWSAERLSRMAPLIKMKTSMTTKRTMRIPAAISTASSRAKKYRQRWQHSLAVGRLSRVF